MLASIDKSKTITYKELIVLIHQDGSIELDWQLTEETMEPSQFAHQEEVYRRYRENAHEAFLVLGFLEKTVVTSGSLRYLRLIASTFVKKLAMNPDLEVLHENVVIEIDDNEVVYLLQQAPYIKGAEYLTYAWMKKAWETLNQTFGKMIKSYQGSVEDFFATYNPNVHLVGQVFFHLVESKKEEYPFGFLPTYAADVPTHGTSKHLPLKNALVDYGENSRKLLELISTVHKKKVKKISYALSGKIKGLKKGLKQ
ncbi:MAG: hypothetical protein ACYDGZ_00835 [Desulfosporosinus fructosivorans]